MSKEDLQRDKLLAEIENIKVITENLKSQNEPQKVTIDSLIKKWTGAIISIVSVLAAVWGLLIPINGYITDQNSILKYQLNSQMVELLNGLDSTNTVADRSILLLSYYENNSLPILIFKLERTNPFQNGTLVNNITNVIGNINESNQDDVEDIVTTHINNLVSKIELTNQADHFTIFALRNLFFVIRQLAIQGHSINAYKNLIRTTESSLKSMDAALIETLELVFEQIDGCKEKMNRI